MTSIAAACRDVLMSGDPATKVRAARAVARAWRRGALEHRFDLAMPDAPARPDRPELLPAARMPKRGRGGSAKGRLALLHALAHIEFSAIDLAFDVAGRFGAEFPRGFIDDWLSVGADEAMHFAILDRRLRALGSGYGELPAHAGLWEAGAASPAHASCATSSPTRSGTSVSARSGSAICVRIKRFRPRSIGNSWSERIFGVR